MANTKIRTKKSSLFTGRNLGDFLYLTVVDYRFVEDSTGSTCSLSFAGSSGTSYFLILNPNQWISSRSWPLSIEHGILKLLDFYPFKFYL